MVVHGRSNKDQYAAIMGLKKDLKLTGNEFSNTATWFFIAYLIAEVPNGRCSAPCFIGGSSLGPNGLQSTVCRNSLLPSGSVVMYFSGVSLQRLRQVLMTIKLCWLHECFLARSRQR